MHRRSFLVSSAAAIVAAPAIAGPSADLWPRWQAHKPGSAARVDHGAWDGLLANFRRQGTDGVARVDYRGLLSTGRGGIDAYVRQLEAAEVSALDRAEQMAFWINLYNALTLKVVLDHYPVASIRDIDISPGLFANGPWGATLARVEGEEVSLDDIEHRILRPIWKDPRVHYAVNCASVGCPNLAGQAFTGARLETMLEAGAKAYATDPRGCSVANGRVTASKIYDWFQEDFGGTEAGVLAHLRQHGARGLDGFSDIDSYDYDWSLNTTSNATG